MFFTSLEKCLVFLTPFPLEAGVSLLTIVARSFHFFWRSVLVPSVFRSRSFHFFWRSVLVPSVFRSRSFHCDRQ